MVEDKNHKHRNKPNRMSDAEIMVILVLFHSGGFRCFKHYYKEYVCKHLTHLFPRRVSYNRFVELEKEVLLQLTIFIKEVLLGTCTGISFVDSTPLRVCRNQHILIHKTFKGLAERGKCSMGWFFGFKLHLIINDKGEILNFMFTPGNVDDREPLKQTKFLKNIKGKLCADKGYIGQTLFENLFLNGIQLITKVKNFNKKPVGTYPRGAGQSPRGSRGQRGQSQRRRGNRQGGERREKYLALLPSQETERGQSQKAKATQAAKDLIGSCPLGTTNPIKTDLHTPQKSPLTRGDFFCFYILFH